MEETKKIVPDVFDGPIICRLEAFDMRKSNSTTGLKPNLYINANSKSASNYNLIVWRP